MTKVFNGRSATDEYMSTHSLTFSTPEMTLKKFALWLGEQVNAPDKGGQMPRAMLYVEEKGGKSNSELAPDTDDTFKPTGAVADMYGDTQQSGASTGQTMMMTPPQLTPLNRETLEPESGGSSSKFCISCGQKLKANAKFCTKCGSVQ